MPRLMGDGSRKVARNWRYTDPQTGAVTKWEKGNPYTGPMNIPWLDDPIGFDKRGPLLEPISPPAPAPVEKAVPVNSDSKEK